MTVRESSMGQQRCRERTIYSALSLRERERVREASPSPHALSPRERGIDLSESSEAEDDLES
jgi:hypothetical protein